MSANDRHGHVVPSRGVVIVGHIDSTKFLLGRMVAACQAVGVVPLSAEHARIVDMPIQRAIDHLMPILRAKEASPMPDKFPKTDRVRELREQKMTEREGRMRSTASTMKAIAKRPVKSTAKRKR